MRQLQFPTAYFDEETRDGFTISVMMKHVWAAQVEVLYTITQFCEKHNITYYADWGTLLGTIRHKGFIPWDDDLDICMKREDYLRFMTLFLKEMPKSYELLSPYTSENYYQYFMRVVNSKCINVEHEWMDEFHGCPYSVGVDIFPLDYIPRNKEDAFVQQELIGVIATTAENLEKKKDMEHTVKEIHKIEDACQVKLDWNQSIVNQLYRLVDQMSGIFKEEESDSLAKIFALFEYPNAIFQKEWYDETILMPFEGMNLRVPKDYDKILTNLYGDYMTPVISTKGHDYPFYKGQEEILLQKLEKANNEHTLEEFIAQYRY
ncbi:MAG: LicD family protein [Lachnospiraceae bacterium]|nr:LicD family protein [Lachnospiraceae bacterium]